MMAFVNWITLVVLAVFAGRWLGYLTVKAINGMMYEIEILRRNMAENEEE